MLKHIHKVPRHLNIFNQVIKSCLVDLLTKCPRQFKNIHFFSIDKGKGKIITVTPEPLHTAYIFISFNLLQSRSWEMSM